MRAIRTALARLGAVDMARAVRHVNELGGNASDGHSATISDLVQATEIRERHQGGEDQSSSPMDDRG